MRKNSYRPAGPALPTVAHLETMLSLELETRIMRPGMGILHRVADALRRRGLAPSQHLTRYRLRRLRDVVCQMPDGRHRRLPALAEITVLTATGLEMTRYRLVVDPGSLHGDGRISAGLSALPGGRIRTFPIRLIGTKAVVPLSTIHPDFEPVVVDIAGDFVRCRRRYDPPANSNICNHGRPYRGGGPQLVHSR